MATFAPTECPISVGEVIFTTLSGMLPFGKYNVRILSMVPWPYIQQLYTARLEYLEYARQALAKRYQDNRCRMPLGGKQSQDIMQRFIEAQHPKPGGRMDVPELRAQASSLMVAGASTGSITMNWMTYYFSKNPSVKNRIIHQLDEMFPDNLDAGTPLPSRC
ncbi:hypothetical protein AYL99_11864 [Fonsecaea erecta]|uniref:Uncharacterized protein n=1 Tax=Fonsecaea erecta TaxID=1367422 RepID=A0A178Z2Q7_9EURO|nr:hypothetical protein AYL99_11864 [Fonsecaea erecta]OAP53984.1 hypothetical protein AYL99_11864 [Fonsecaea erecta]